MQNLTQLGYVGLEVSDLAGWERFATEVLGLQARQREDGAVALRMDEYAQRIVLHAGQSDDLLYAGWELADEAALEAMVEHLQAGGTRVTEQPRETAAARGVARLFATSDPDGNRVELYYGPTIADSPFRSTRVGGGFVTGAGGLGHIVLATPSAKALEGFYCRLLGLRLSDRIQALIGGAFPLEITFLHANPRHHSLAFAEAPLPKRLHHLMLEVGCFDDVGLAFDRCLDGGVPISQGLGRHPNDKMFSFYARTPSGFEVEYGWGGLNIDDESWHVRTYTQLSEWGHRPPAA